MHLRSAAPLTPLPVAEDKPFSCARTALLCHTHYLHCSCCCCLLLQTSFFFGYNALVCYAFLMMLGSIGFRASLIFVRHIYRRVGACQAEAKYEMRAVPCVWVCS